MKAARLGHEEVSYSDRISCLPDDLLLQILSLIPVRNAISTSLLSKRWKSVWKMLPRLEFVETCHDSLEFEEFCGSSLRLHEAPVLKTLILKLKKHYGPIDTLLFPNINSTLHEITIKISSSLYPSSYRPIRFPNNLKLFQTLVFLKLEDKILVDVLGYPVCFPSLKTMHLIRVKFSRKESLRKLLSACPRLEDLVFERLSSVGHFFFSISVPSLQRLFFTRDLGYYYNDDPSLEINTPSLKYLKIHDRKVRFIFLEDMPKLVEADVCVHHFENGKLMRLLTSVEHLSIQYPSMDLHLTYTLIFNRLLHLEVDTCYNFSSNLLLRFLKHFLNLQSLKLYRTHPRDIDDDQLILHSEPNSVTECLSFHLETLHWIGYAGTYEETDAAVYFLKNACCLKTATISLHSRGMQNDMVTCMELKSMSKASTSCQLIVEF